MSNREKLAGAIETAHPKLKEEIRYQLEDVDHEEDYDIVDAFEDAMDSIEATKDKELMKYLKDFFIQIGYAVPISEEEMSKMYVSGGKKYWFKKNGIFYEAIDSWRRWINQ